MEVFKFCLATTGVTSLRLPNNDGIRPNTSQYVRVVGKTKYNNEDNNELRGP
jgi:hypothetical protein